MENLDLRIQRTYKLLLAALEELLDQKDFEEITVTEICEKAMIRRPTFYKHFLDKYDFLTFFIKNKMQRIFDEAFQKLKEETQENFFVFIFEQLLKQPDNLLYLIFNLQMRSDIMIELESIQKYGQEMLASHVEIDEDNKNSIHMHEYHAQIIMGITIQSVHWYKENREKITKEEATRLYKEILEKLQITNN